jgi:oligoribonuclease
MHLNVLAEGPVLAIHQSMKRWTRWMHGTRAHTPFRPDRPRQGLHRPKPGRRRADRVHEAVGTRGKAPMCGNTIGQDRRFMVRYMPKLEAFFHYRNIDVSTLKELCKRWKPEIVAGFKKHQKHTALADIIESIEELKYYREHFIKL